MVTWSAPNQATEHGAGTPATLHQPGSLHQPRATDVPVPQMSPATCVHAFCFAMLSSNVPTSRGGVCATLCHRHPSPSCCLGTEGSSLIPSSSSSSSSSIPAGGP